MADEKKPQAAATEKKVEPKAKKEAAPAAKRPVPKFEIQIGPNHMFYWKFLNEGKILVTSKAFPDRDAAFASIRIIKDSVPAKGAVERKAENGKTFFRVKTSSHQFVAASEMFATPEACDQAIAAMRRAPQAAVIDRTAK
jgi:uncharacterized protein YegP (UPF0339 family)